MVLCYEWMYGLGIGFLLDFVNVGLWVFALRVLCCRANKLHFVYVLYVVFWVTSSFFARSFVCWFFIGVIM